MHLCAILSSIFVAGVKMIRIYKVASNAFRVGSDDSTCYLVLAGRGRGPSPRNVL
jgi:hypothetical protein